MITVICTQCRAHLEMDDAFAGGVCRCQHCGTIQTVPPMSKLRPRQPAPTAVAAAPAGVGAPPPGYGHGGVAPRPHGAAIQADDGLDALAEAVASSSGLGRGSLRSGPPAASQGDAPAAQPAVPLATVAIPVDYARPTPSARRNYLALIVLAAVTLCVLVLGTGLYFARSVQVSSATVVPAVPPGVPVPAVPTPGDGGDGGDGPEVVVPQHPHFCGVSLENVPSVVYVLDRGQATGALFDTLKEATYRSVESLKPGQKFAILFWDNGNEEAAYPASGGLAAASAADVQAAREQFAEVYAGGRADARPAIERAAALKPSVIVLVTGKAFDLEPELVDATQQAVTAAGGRTKVHTFSLMKDEGNTVLADIAKATGGESKVIGRHELRQYSE